MTPEPVRARTDLSSEAPGAPPRPAKDAVASLCGQVPSLSTGDRAILRRLFLTRSEVAVGVVTGLLLRAEVPDAAFHAPATFRRWQLLAHAAAVLSGTAAVKPHNPAASLGRALQEAGYSSHRLMRLTSAQGEALTDQIIRAVRMLAAAGQVPVNLRTLHDLSRDIGEGAEQARLRIARDYYAAAHASKKDAS